MAHQNFFTQAAAEGYDARNARMADISRCLHFLMRLQLKALPSGAQVLCVGVGTGAEIFALAESFPDSTFFGVDPSAEMLSIARSRLESAGFSPRCELKQGFVHELNLDQFDAGIAILVGHFVPKNERASFYQEIAKRVKSGGLLINAEISQNFLASDFSAMLEKWQSLHSEAGATAEALAGMERQLREVLTVLPPSEIEGMLQQSGLKNVAQFFQAFLIRAWAGVKA